MFTLEAPPLPRPVTTEAEQELRRIARAGLVAQPVPRELVVRVVAWSLLTGQDRLGSRMFPSARLQSLRRVRSLRIAHQ